MEQEKIKESQQYEISLTELAAAIYLFFIRKWLFIVALTVAGLVMGFLFTRKGSPARYMVKVKISSAVVKPILINNALSNIWCESCDESDIEKSGAYSKEISTGIVYMQKMDDSSMTGRRDQNTIKIILFVDDSAKTEIVVNDIVKFILKNDTIKNITRNYRIFYKDYMTKLDERIAEIEAFQKIFQPGTSDKKFEATIVKGWRNSTQDYLDLLDRRFFKKIWNDSENPVSVEIISVKKIIARSLSRRLVLYGFSFFILSVFLGFAYDFHKKVLSHIRKNVI